MSDKFLSKLPAADHGRASHLRGSELGVDKRAVRAGGSFPGPD